MVGEVREVEAVSSMSESCVEVAGVGRATSVSGEDQQRRGIGLVDVGRALIGVWWSGLPLELVGGGLCWSVRVSWRRECPPRAVVRRYGAVAS